jgi:hypothetical protein
MTLLLQLFFFISLFLVITNMFLEYNKLGKCNFYFRKMQMEKGIYVLFQSHVIDDGLHQPAMGEVQYAMR